MKTWIFIFFTLAAAFLPGTLSAQTWFFSASGSTRLTDHPFAFRYDTTAWIQDLSAEAGYETDSWSLSWAPAVRFISTDPDYNNLSGNLRFAWFATESWTAEAGLWHQNGASDAPGLTVLNPWSGLYYHTDTDRGWTEAGLTLEGAWYDQAEELDQLLLTGYAETNLSFETKTSVTAGAEAGVKYFLTDSDQTGIHLADTTEAILQSGIAVEGNGRMNGKSGLNGVSSGSGSGSGSGAQSSRSLKSFAGLADLWVKVSQNVTDRISLTGTGSLHYSLTAAGGKGSSVASLASDYTDDNSGYNFQSASLALNFRLPAEVLLTATTSAGWKQYHSQLAWAGSETLSADSRSDEFYHLQLSVEKSFALAQDQTLKIAAFAGHKVQTSTSYWYEFESGDTGLTLSWQF